MIQGRVIRQVELRHRRIDGLGLIPSSGMVVAAVVVATIVAVVVVVVVVAVGDDVLSGKCRDCGVAAATDCTLYAGA